MSTLPISKTVPTTICMVDDEAFTALVQVRKVDHTYLRISSAEKAHVDVFRSPNRLGLDDYLEGLDLLRRHANISATLSNIAFE